MSKPITWVTVFTLIEEGRLRLDHLVFGPNGVLGFDYGSSYPGRVQKTPGIGFALDRLMWALVASVPEWQVNLQSP